MTWSQFLCLYTGSSSYKSIQIVIEITINHDWRSVPFVFTHTQVGPHTCSCSHRNHNQPWLGLRPSCLYTGRSSSKFTQIVVEIIIDHDSVSVLLVNTYRPVPHSKITQVMFTRQWHGENNQVVTLAVYSYFGAAVIGAQWVIPDNEQAYKVNHLHHVLLQCQLLFCISLHFYQTWWKLSRCFVQQAYSLPVGDTKAKLDLFYPFFLTIQFAFFFGWLKVIISVIIIGIITISTVIISTMISHHPVCLLLWMA